MNHSTQTINETTKHQAGLFDHRRKHARFSADYKLMVSKGSANFQKARCINLSLGGMMFCHLDGEFKVGDKIYIEVIDEKDYAHRLLVARVAHTGKEQVGQFNITVTGVEFIQMHTSNEEMIDSMIINQLDDWASFKGV